MISDEQVSYTENPVQREDHKEGCEEALVPSVNVWDDDSDS